MMSIQDSHKCQERLIPQSQVARELWALYRPLLEQRDQMSSALLVLFNVYAV